MGLEAGYVAYVSKHRNYSVTAISPRREYMGPHMIYNEGFTAQFRGHIFTTNDPEIIKAMDASDRYGQSFQRVTGPEQYEIIKQYGTRRVRFNRGPATTMAEKLGAPKTVPIDTVAISKIAPPTKVPEPAVPAPPERRGPGRPRKDT